MGSPSQNAKLARKFFDYFPFPTFAEKRKWSQRGSRKPLATIRSFKRYMPAAVCELLDFCCCQYLYEWKNCGLNQDDLWFVATDRKMGGPSSTFDNCLDDLSQRHEIASHYPGNAQTYISLTSREFSDFICVWIGAVSDCYNLRANPLQTTICTYDKAPVLEVIKDSDRKSGAHCICRNFSFEKGVWKNGRNEGYSASPSCK